MHTRILAALCVAAAPWPALADGLWTVVDLGLLKREEHCVEAGLDAVRAVGARFGVGEVRYGDWTIYAHGLAGEAHDALITCTFGEAHGTRATLVIYSREKPVAARMVSEVVEREFRRSARSITRRWVAELVGAS